MQFIRDNKSLDKLSELSKALMDETSEDRMKDVVGTVCENLINHTSCVNISDTILAELGLREWIQENAATKGGGSILVDLISKPTYDTAVLQSRGTITNTFPYNGINFTNIHNLECAALWLLSVPTNIGDAYPLPLLYPSWPVLYRLNNVAMFVTALYLFKAFVSPLLNIAYPLTSVFGPYIYLRRYLKIEISLSTYLSFLKTALGMFMKPTGNMKQDSIKYISVIVYVLLYVYTIYNGFEIAYMIRKFKCELVDKWIRVHALIQMAKDAFTVVPDSVLCKFANIVEIPSIENLFNLDTSLASLYKLLTTQSLRDELKWLLRKTYIIDAICSSARLRSQKGWCKCTYGSTTKIWAMGHPLLGKQVRNPLVLEKNIIITGPNAAGKTTYMKAVCANMILSQSLGICCGVKCVIQPVHSILSSMNIIDTVGKESLFEAEVRRCGMLVDEATKVRDLGHRAMFFLDEPMHSTPPTEGTATAMAVAEYLGSTPGVFVFMTTHYHQVTQLEQMHPTSWMNVCMDAMPHKGGLFHFPYRLRKGASFQCIALELLKERSLPDNIIESAIEMKNKICNNVLENVV